MGLSAEDRARALAPPLATEGLSGIGGSIRMRPEDFRVDELAAYGPDGREHRHLLVRFEKRGLDTEEAVRRLCRHAGVARREAGIAGRKDRDAVTTQWISLPAAASGLDTFDEPGLRVLEVHPHGQKLRTGHLRGNRFQIVVRGPAVSTLTALSRVRAKLEHLRRLGGLENLYGPQRFGREGRNLERGFAVLASGHLRRGDEFVASAAQSALFNLYVLERRLRGIQRQVLQGDVVRRTDSGGLFVVEDAAVEQGRMDRGELVVTGPIYGARMRWPAEGPSRALEEEVLAAAGLGREQLAGFAKRLPGSRRPVLVDPEPVTIVEAPAVDDLPPGVALGFTLPSGSFATQLLAELQEPRPREEE